MLKEMDLASAKIYLVFAEKLLVLNSRFNWHRLALHFIRHVPNRHPGLAAALRAIHGASA